MNKLEFMQAVIETAKMVKEMTPESIAADAQAIADGITLTQDELAKRDAYNDLLNSTNEAVAQLKIDQGNLATAQAELQRGNTKLADDLKALEHGRKQLEADQKALVAAQQQLANAEKALDQRKKDADARDIAQNERDDKLDERESAIAAREKKAGDALAIMQS